MGEIQVEIKWKQFRRVPKKNYILFATALIVCIYSFVQICLPMYRSLDQLEEREIKIDSVYLEDGHRNTFPRLWISSGEEKYYVSYPQYRAYRELVEADLFSGRVTTVSVRVSYKQTLHDRLHQWLRTVEIRQGETVYFGLEDEKDNLRLEYYGSWLLFVLVFLFLLVFTVFEICIYGLVRIHKRRSAK